MTLLFMHEGPMLKYRNGFLDIDDLNPEQHMRWRLSRIEMLRLGVKCLWAALTSRG